MRCDKNAEEAESETRLEPRVLVPKVVRSRSRNEAEFGSGAAVLALLVLRLDGEFVAADPAREALDAAQRAIGELRLPRRLVRHPLEEPEVRGVLGRDLERHEEATLGDGRGVDG